MPTRSGSARRGRSSAVVGGSRFPRDLREPGPGPRDDRALPRAPRRRSRTPLRRCSRSARSRGCCRSGWSHFDGTLIAGNASQAANRSYASIREEVEQILGEAAAIDADEDARFRRGGAATSCRPSSPSRVRGGRASSAARRSSSASRPSKTPITSAISPGPRPGKLSTGASSAGASRQRPTRLRSSGARSTPQTPTRVR